MKTYAPGTVLTHDFQSDPFGGRYEILEHLGGREYLVRDLPDTDEIIEEIGDYYATPGAYLEWVDPFGPGRRRATPEESWLLEVERRAEYRNGEPRKVRFATAAEYHAHF